MPRVETAQSTLVLEGGQTVDSSNYLMVDSTLQLGAPGTQRLALILEPVVLNAGAERVAAEIGARFAEELDARRSVTATAALLSAVEEINAWLVQLNAVRPAHDRHYFGFTCILTRDDEAFVIQSAPSQILITQDAEIYAFPGLDSWRWHQQQTDHEAHAAPLGLTPDIQPDLYHTRLAPGDLIVLCSSSLARVIDRAPQDAFARGDAPAALAHLEELAGLFSIDDAWAAALAVTERTRRQRGSDVALLQRVSEWCSHFLPEETAARLRRQPSDVDAVPEVDLDGDAVQTHGYSVGMPSTDDVREDDWEDAFGGTAGFGCVDVAQEQDTGPDALLEEAPKWQETDEYQLYWSPESSESLDHADPAHASEPAGRGRGVSDLLAGALLAFSAAVVGVRQITINRDRLSGPRDDGTLGVPRLSRYDDAYRMPNMSGVRSWLPRLPISRATALAVAALALAVIAGLIFTVHTKHERARKAEIAALFQTAETQRQKAGQTTDLTAAQAGFQQAQDTVNKAVALGLDPQQAARERAAISADMDHVLKIERLSNIQALGTLPPAPAGVTPRVFSGNGQLYVFTDALYRLDGNGTTLVRLIGGGDKIDGQDVGTLVGAAWGDGAPLVFDGTSAYLFDPPNGKWARQKVGSLGGPQNDIAAISGYSGNLYLLSPSSGQIIKYSGGAYDAKPEDWTAGANSDDLKNAVDFEIDGHIYVLLKDGRVLDFYRSALETTLTPQVTPPIKSPVGLSMQTDRPYIYEADAGRILRLNRTDGTLVQQFMAGDGSPSFDNVRAVAVDDVLSTAYILTDNTLMTVRLPGPPH